MMAAPMPHPFQAHVPATPPPDQPLFGKGPMSPDMSKTTTTTTSQEEAFFNMFAANAQQVREQQRQKQRQQNAQQQQQQQQQPTPVSSRQSSSSAPVPQPQPSPQQTNLPFGMKTTSPTDPTQQQQLPTTIPTLDPKYLAMASRIAAYYQQRCQAIANFQQQRCQQWANMQRAKCQEMMQATMLVVAWYIRDRIQRRRRKQKSVFKHGLEQRERQRQYGLCSRGGAGGGGNGGKVTKGEVVRRWVLDVPIGLLRPTSSSPAPAAATTAATTTTGNGKVVPQPSPEVHDPLQDQAEAIFALGGNGDELPETKTEDKDSQLFTIADNLIKSQLARIDVPLLGVLNLDESDSEESSEEEEYYDDDYEEDYEGEEYDEDEEGEYEDEEGEGEEENVVYECVYGNDQGPTMKVTAVPSLHQHQQQQQQHAKTEEVVMSPEGMGSEEVQLGTTGSGSAGRKRGASEIS